MRPPDPVTTVAILGAGTIGASWAALFAARGLAVRLWDPAEDGEVRARQLVEEARPALQRLGLTVAAAISDVTFCPTPEDAVSGAGFVQESAPEDLSIKAALLDRLDGAMGEDTVLASSTSGLAISDLQAGRSFAARMVTGHPFNPPHLVPLVEVVGGRETDPAVVDWALAFYRRHGKRPIHLRKEVPGHLVNRMQAALWREAIDAVASGLASVEDVDTAITQGPGLRWAAMGPHMTFHIGGGDGGMNDYLQRFGPSFENWWADLGQPTFTPEVRRALVDGVAAEAAGRSVADLRAERDAALLAVIAALAAGSAR